MFPAGRKCENPQTPTQSAVRAKAILSARLFGMHGSTGAALLIPDGVEKNSIQCLLDEAASILDTEDCPSMWVYIQVAEHHAGPAPGQNNCPGPEESPLTPLQGAASGAKGNYNNVLQENV